VTAFRDNPLAIAESSSGAPVVFAGWHPVDKVTIGDGKTGLIYDHSVTGNVANVTTANFEDGYEYRIFVTDMSHNNASNQRLQLQAYMQTAAAYITAIETDAGGSGAQFGLHAEFFLPRVVSRSHFILTMRNVNGVFSPNIDTAAATYTTTAQKILNARISFAAGSIDGGKVYLFRRREYASLP
jgi:hypothetical protein